MEKIFAMLVKGQYVIDTASCLHQEAKKVRTFKCDIALSVQRDGA